MLMTAKNAIALTGQGKPYQQHNNGTGSYGTIQYSAKWNQNHPIETLMKHIVFSPNGYHY